MKTIAVNLRKEKYDVYCGRGSVHGNPFIIGKDGTREEVIAKHRIYFYKRIKCDASFRQATNGLKGKRLACFCKPLACHLDTIVEYLEGKDIK